MQAADRRGLVAGLAACLVVGCVLVRKVGLGAPDVLLTFMVGGFALAESRRGGGKGHGGLLGEDEVELRWWPFVCEHHNVLGCVVRGKSSRSRSERFLTLAISTLALLYWKALLRPPPVRMGSLQGLRSSLMTLLVTKVVQWLMKRLIRFFAGRTASWQERAGWMELLSLQWRISQYWALGFMLLCVLLALLEGRNWVSLLTGWLIQMGFGLVVMDLAFCYLRFRLLGFGLRARRLAVRGVHGL